MNSQSEDIDCNKTVASTDASKCNRFIYDVTLDISFVADAEWKNYWCLRKIMLAAITGQIGHKYKNWKKCSWVIAEHLMQKFMELNQSPTEWKGTISVSGQYVDEDSVNGVSEIIYDWFSYDGFMTVPKLSKYQYMEPSVCLQYTIRFFLSPALPIAQYIYCKKGYEKLPHMFKETWCEDIINMEVDREKEYNHLRVWQAAYNTFNL